jgi:class 3 adenylate cyclase/tetratricopeptide (TPR) repeat protein
MTLIDPIRFDQFILDPPNTCLWRGTHQLTLRPKDFAVLHYLVKHAERLVPKTELLEAVWPETHVGDGVLKSCIKRIRRVLGDDPKAPRFIETRHRQGYRFIGIIRQAEPVDKEQPSQSADSSKTALPAVVSPLPLPFFRMEQSQATWIGYDGERKLVTVLYAHLTGVPALFTDRDPEEAQQLLGTVLHTMLEAVHRYEGTVHRVLDDGVIAFFGVPLAQEDHALRACYAALAMQDALRQYIAVYHTLPIPLQMHIGLSAGEMVVRAIGDKLHPDYAAIGQTTHLATQIAYLAPPGNIWLTKATLRLVEGFVQVNSLGEVLFQGLATPMELFTLVGTNPLRRRLQAIAARNLTRFVGRQTELDILQQALSRARVGHGQIVAIISDPGLGKTRLCYEFLQSLHTQGWCVLESTAMSYGKAIPYFPIIELLKTYFQIEDRATEHGIRERITHKLRTLDSVLQPTLPALLTLFNVPSEEPVWQSLDPTQRRQRILEACKRLLLQESQIQPVLVVLENLQWIDAETQAFLDSLLESLPTARMLLLVNYRPEYQHSWGSKTYYTQIRLDSLNPAQVEEFLYALLGNDPSLVPLKRLLLERTEGNPFFLEESVQALYTQGVLVRENGTTQVSPHLTTPLTTIQIPATVQAVLAARIDQLPAEEKHLLQTAAVIGTVIPCSLIQAIVEISEEELYRHLKYLQTTEFLYETRLFPEREYTFKHALTHQVAYDSLLPERRRALHARIMKAIEVLSPDLVNQVEHLAYHAFRGEIWDKALVYYRQAGTRAMMRSAYREAVAYFEQALLALQHLPESRDTIERGIDLRLELRQALYPLGELERILDYLRETETLAAVLGDQYRLGWVSVYMSNYFWLMGNPDQAVKSGQRALTLGKALGDFPLQLETNYRLGQVYWTMGDYRRALDLLGWNVASLTGESLYQRFDLTDFPSVISRNFLVRCFAELGMFAEGIARGVESIQIVEVVDHPFDLTSAYFNVGYLYLRKGDLHQAILLLERSLGLCQGANRSILFPVLFPIISSALGYAYALSGRITEALPLLEQAVEQAVSMRQRANHALRVVHLSEAYLLAGHVDNVLDHALRALALSREYKEQGHEAYALRLLGEIHAHRDPPEVEQAEDYYRQALALADALGMCPLQAHCHHGLGTLYSKGERQEQAHAALSIALELYRAMAMTFWLAKAEAALTGMG